MPLTAPQTADFHRRTDATSRRRGALVACTLGALLLNAAGLAAGDAVSGSGLTPITKPIASPNRPLLLVPPRPTIEATATATQPQPEQPASHSASQTEPLPAPPAEAPLAWAKGTEVQAATEQPIRFYRFTEVDRPADPQTDWAIEPETLDKLGLQRLAFEVLIDDRGEIVGCTILDPPALAEDIRNDLEDKLRATPMNPALRAEQRVASVRRIELFLAAEGQ